MDLLTATACVLILRPDCSQVSKSFSPGVETWQSDVASSAARFGIPQAWIKAVMAQESGGRTTLYGQPIRSSAGAMGLMQLMPKTYEDMRRQFDLGANPDIPRDNIAAGTAYLRQLYVRYGYPRMFAAYNAGPGRFDDFLLRQKPLPDETIRYLKAIVPGVDALFGHQVGAVSSPSSPAERSFAAAKKDALFFEPAVGIGLVGGDHRALFVTLSQPHS